MAMTGGIGPDARIDADGYKMFKEDQNRPQARLGNCRRSARAS